MWWFIGIVVVVILVAGLAVRSRRRRAIGKTPDVHGTQPGYQGTEQQKTIGRYGEHL